VMDELSSRARRFTALLLLAATAVLLWVAMVAPLLNYGRSASEARASNLRSLSRDRALLALEPKIRSALDATNHSPRWTRFYESRKPEQAVLQLETDLQELLKSPNNPTSMIAQPASMRGALTRVRVKITLTMTIDQLAQTLARIGSYSKQLQIESLTIQAPDYQAVDSNPNLSIQAEIAGFMLTPKARI
jgi:hypothetical protein